MPTQKGWHFYYNLFYKKGIALLLLYNYIDGTFKLILNIKEGDIMADKKELNVSQVSGGSIGYNKNGDLLIYSKGDDGKDYYTGVSFDKFHAKEAMAFDKAINGSRSLNGPTGSYVPGNE